MDTFIAAKQRSSEAAKHSTKKNLNLIPNNKNLLPKSLNDLLLDRIKKNYTYEVYYYKKTDNGYMDFSDVMEDKYSWSLNALYDDDYKEKFYSGEILNEFKNYSLIRSDILNKTSTPDFNSYIEDVCDTLKLDIKGEYIIIRISRVKKK